MSGRFIAASALFVALLAPVAASAALRGDVTLDNKVDSADVLALMAHLRATPTLSAASLAAADIGPLVDIEIAPSVFKKASAPDGVVDIGDLVVLSQLVAREIGPEAPTLNSIVAPGSNQVVQVIGKAAPGVTVRLFINGADRDITLTAPPSEGDNFTFGNIALDVGSNDVYVVAEKDGLTSAPSNVVQATLSDQISARTYPAPISGTVVWTPGNTPGYQGAFVIKASPTYTIPSGAVLVIAPGTEVRFEAGAKLIVNGRLIVEGTEANPVVFTANSSTTRGFWDGIELSGGSSGSSVLRYARVEYAKTGVTIDQCPGGTCSIGTVRHSVIREFSLNGIMVGSDAVATIVSNTIDNSAGSRAGNGISVGSLMAVLIQDNLDIRGTLIGILISDSIPTVSGNRIRQNDAGIVISGALSNANIVDGNVITENKTGIRAQSLYVYTPSRPRMADPKINRNAIYGNVSAAQTIKNFEATQSLGYSLALNASANWWGTTDPAGIAATIIDNADDQDLPLVDYSLFLDSEGGVSVDLLLSGDLTTSRTLNPTIAYEVLGTFRVMPTGSLTIPAGTKIQFRPGAKLRVEGTLSVNPTAGTPVEFNPLGSTTTPGSWIGIEIAGSNAVAHIAKAKISFAKVAIQVVDASNVTIETTEIHRSLETGIAMDGVGASAVLSGNLIDRSGQPRDPLVQEIGIDLVDSSPLVTGNEIHDFDIGVRIFGASQPRLGSVGPPVIPGNLISQNAVGIRLEGTGLTSGDPLPVIERNSIFDNATSNVETKRFSPGYAAQLGVRQNWWGTTDPAAIRAKFRFDGDNPVVFDFASYLDGPGGASVAGSAPAPSFLLSGLSVQPSSRRFSPTLGAQARIDFTATLPADVTLQIFTERVIDAARQAIPRVLIATQTQTGVLGASYFTWNGRNQSGAFVPDEAYTYVLTATGAGITSVFDPGLNADDGHAVASIPGAYNVYVNDFLDFDVTIHEVAAEGRPFPRRATIVAEPAPYSPSFPQVVIADSRPFVELVPYHLRFDGRGADGALITEFNGNPYASPITVRSLYPDKMRPNYLIVEHTKPEVRGIAPPKLEVESLPFLVTQSYDQVSRFGFQLDQSAFVEVKVLKPGFGDPDDPNAVLATLPISGAPAQPLAKDTAYSAEWHGYQPDQSAANAPADGNYTFVIKAISAVDPAFHTEYRGVVQVRQ